ncbi:MAG TPA: S8 family serine peptidase, partial [Spirochaetota bacterium]|nr:S8 family serine peptidase [Spirochaetota bacterium]
DTYWPGQWGLKNNGMRVAAGWTITNRTEAVIAVLDTGFLTNHPDLGTVNWVSGRDIADKDNGIYNPHSSHGTMTAGCIGAETDNGIGIAGIITEAVIMPVKIAADNYPEYITSEDGAEGIYYAVDNNADIINMSYGGTGLSLLEKEACAYAASNNVFLVAAAGNQGNITRIYPAAVETVFAVSAYDSSRVIADFSSFGTYIAAAAPGVNIRTTDFDTNSGSAGYALVQGTSFAAPYTSAAAALVKGLLSSCNNNQLAALLKDTAADLGTAGYDIYYGYGAVDLEQALITASLPGSSNAYNIICVIENPPDMTAVYTNTSVRITAYSSQASFYSNELFIGSGIVPGSYDLLTNTLQPVTNYNIVSVDPSGYSDGFYTLLLKAYAANGTVSDRHVIALNRQRSQLLTSGRSELWLKHFTVGDFDYSNGSELLYTYNDPAAGDDSYKLTFRSGLMENFPGFPSALGDNIAAVEYCSAIAYAADTAEYQLFTFYIDNNNFPHYQINSQDSTVYETEQFDTAVADITIGDFNGDGLDELVYLKQLSGNSSALVFTGSSYQDLVEITTAAAYPYFLTGDLDADSCEEVLWLEQKSSGSYVLKSYHEGQITVLYTSGTPFKPWLLLDIDSDRCMEIMLVYNDNENNITGAAVLDHEGMEMGAVYPPGLTAEHTIDRVSPLLYGSQGSIAFRYTDGYISLYNLNGAVHAGWDEKAVMDMEAAAFGDISGDGVADALFVDNKGYLLYYDIATAGLVSNLNSRILSGSPRISIRDTDNDWSNEINIRGEDGTFFSFNTPGRPDCPSFSSLIPNIKGQYSCDINSSPMPPPTVSVAGSDNLLSFGSTVEAYAAGAEDDRSITGAVFYASADGSNYFPVARGGWDKEDGLVRASLGKSFLAHYLTARFIDTYGEQGPLSAAIAVTAVFPSTGEKISRVIPNPFTVSGREAVIYLYTDNKSFIVDIYSFNGRHVRTLDQQGTEVYRNRMIAVFNGRDENNRLLSSGVYYYIVRLEDQDNITSNPGGTDNRVKGKVILINE